MIIWRGWGILVILIAAVFTVPLGFLAAETVGSESAGLGAGAGLLLGAVGVYFAGAKLNAPKQGFHPGTGQPVEYRNAHTFFFVPMQYWGFILPIGGVAAILSAFPL
ncbi:MULTISPECIES: hypothetical protein [unclassified Nocardiopsis]|uniref:hypothetical protein n=1 Tax=unclassified Nocardiopsis TaxID=2649073 RepID=UPI0033C8D0FE